MNDWLYFIPLVSAFLGWLLHKLAVLYFLNKYWPQKQSQISKDLGDWASGIFSFSEVEQKITHPSVLEKALPAIETHIDKFLNEKLQKEIPMLSMFVGTKTTDKIKDIFVGQLKELFPTVMTQMAGSLKENFDITEKVNKKLSEPAVQKAVTMQLSNQLKSLPVLGLVSGFIIGLMNLLIIYIIY